MAARTKSNWKKKKKKESENFSEDSDEEMDEIPKELEEKMTFQSSPRPQQGPRSMRFVKKEIKKTRKKSIGNMQVTQLNALFLAI